MFIIASITDRDLDGQKILIFRYEKKLFLKFGSPNFKIGRSTAVLIFGGWPLKNG